MAESNSDKVFSTKVLPVMDRVMAELRSRQVDETRSHFGSMSFILAGAAGPDGGMASQQASLDSLRMTGKWNSKHTEDYIQMVKAELNKQHIVVTPEIEAKMIDKMIKDQIPRSSIEYVMKKAATNTLFYLPQALNKTPLEAHIDQQAEQRYNPSTIEKGAGYVLGATADFLTLGGGGGGFSTAAKWVGVGAVVGMASDSVASTDNVAPSGNIVASSNEAQEDDTYVPMVIDPKYREQYTREQAQIEKQNKAQKHSASMDAESESPANEQEVGEQASAQESLAPAPSAAVDQPTSSAEQANANGWNGLLASFGLNGLSEVGSNLGYVLAMLPDILIGTFTGRTSSLGLKNNLMPLASIVAGLFVKNPLLKMVLIGMGGLNLINKAGHEAIDMQKGNERTSIPPSSSNYKVYEDEPLNERIVIPQIKGNCLVATIDKVPSSITLPQKVIDAYQQGALPLNTLANAVLQKNDQMREMASENYSANAQQTQTRTLAQR